MTEYSILRLNNGDSNDLLPSSCEDCLSAYSCTCDRHCHFRQTLIVMNSSYLHLFFVHPWFSYKYSWLSSCCLDRIMILLVHQVSSCEIWCRCHLMSMVETSFWFKTTLISIWKSFSLLNNSSFLLWSFGWQGSLYYFLESEEATKILIFLLLEYEIYGNRHLLLSNLALTSKDFVRNEFW